MPSNTNELKRAVQHLKKADPILREVIRKAGPYNMKLKRDRFQALVYSILSQQISGSAAAAIRRKLEAALEPEGGLSAEAILRLSPDQLRGVGLSKQKAGYIVDLAQKVASEELELKRLGRMRDEAVIEALVQVKGIGVWTAQMFLMFSLGRLDVMPHGDLGVRTAIQRLYGLEELPNREACYRIAEPWRPYASVGSWYCWRSLELREGEG